MKYISECPNLYGDTTMVEIDDVIEAIRFCGITKWGMRIYFAIMQNEFLYLNRRKYGQR
jgi:hypothetical protein